MIRKEVINHLLQKNVDELTTDVILIQKSTEEEIESALRRLKQEKGKRKSGRINFLEKELRIRRKPEPIVSMSVKWQRDFAKEWNTAIKMIRKG